MSRTLSKLKLLPKPYRQFAIREYVKQKRDKNALTIHDAVMSFVWRTSKHGTDFWAWIYNELGEKNDDISKVNWPKIDK